MPGCPHLAGHQDHAPPPTSSTWHYCLIHPAARGNTSETKLIVYLHFLKRPMKQTSTTMKDLRPVLAHFLVETLTYVSPMWCVDPRLTIPVCSIIAKKNAQSFAFRLMFGPTNTLTFLVLIRMFPCYCGAEKIETRTLEQNRLWHFAQRNRLTFPQDRHLRKYPALLRLLRR